MKNPISHPPLATCYLLLATFLITPQTPKAQEWSEPVTIYSGSINRDLDVVVDTRGHLHAVWAHMVSNNYWWILYSKSTDQGETWSTPYSVGQNNTGWLSSPKIAVDSRDNLFVTYDFDTQSPYQTMVHMRTLDGDTWSQPYVISEGFPGSYYSRLAMDKNDKLYIFWFYYGNNGTICYRTFKDSELGNIIRPWSSNNVFTPRGAIFDDNNLMHFIGDFCNFNNIPDYIPRLYFTKIEDTWSQPSVVCTPYWGVFAMALNRQNQPITSWADRSGPIDSTRDSTLYASFENGEWAAAQCYSNYLAEDIAMIVEKNQTEHIVQSERFGSMKRHLHYRLENGEWSQTTLGEYVSSFIRLLVKTILL